MTGFNWRHDAACFSEDPELFFPVGTVGPATAAQLDRARQVCARCVVRLDCLQWALDAGMNHGVWGGLDEQQRRALKIRGRRTSQNR